MGDEACPTIYLGNKEPDEDLKISSYLKRAYDHWNTRFET